MRGSDTSFILLFRDREALRRDPVKEGVSVRALWTMITRLRRMIPLRFAPERARDDVREWRQALSASISAGARVSRVPADRSSHPQISRSASVRRRLRVASASERNAHPRFQLPSPR